MGLVIESTQFAEDDLNDPEPSARPCLVANSGHKTRPFQRQLRMAQLGLWDGRKRVPVAVIQFEGRSRLYQRPHAGHDAISLLWGMVGLFPSHAS